jgi:hypothetical protein
VSAEFDFSLDFEENTDGKVTMKDLFKSLLAIAAITAAFFVGFHLGKEKEKERIPKFQREDSDGIPVEF